MAPLRKYLHANFTMPPVDPKATRQLRNLPKGDIATPSQPIHESTHGRRCNNSAPASLEPDLDYSLDDD